MLRDERKLPLPEKNSAVHRRIEACLETADVSIHGYSSNGCITAGISMRIFAEHRSRLTFGLA